MPGIYERNFNSGAPGQSKISTAMKSDSALAKDFMNTRPEQSVDKRFDRRIRQIIKAFNLQKACWRPVHIAVLAYAIYRVMFGRDGKYRVAKKPAPKILTLG